MALPGAEEGTDRFGFSVLNKGKSKGFAWVWLERHEPKKPRVPNPGVLAIRVANNAQNDLILSSDTRKFFTEPHYDGYPAILVRLKEVTVADLRVLLEEGWRCQAPKALLQAGAAVKPAKTAKKKIATAKKSASRASKALLLFAVSSSLSGCATMGHVSQSDAIHYARNDVCGAQASDSSCVVRSVERTEQGYRIVIDRRPPAGQDRVAVNVRGGVFKGRHVEVTPLDTASRRQ
jgi:hypothetical protein